MSKAIKVLVYCGGGYIFDEIYRPLIERHNRDWEYVVVLADYYLADVTVETVERLVQEKRVVEYHIVRLPDGSIANCDYHKEFARLVAELSRHCFGLVLLDSDYYLPDRYLLKFAKVQGALAVVLYTSTIWRIVEVFRKREGKETVPSPTPRSLGGNPLTRFAKKNERLYAFLSALRRGGRPSWIWRSVRSRLWCLFHHYLYPLLFFRNVFPRNKYDHYAFTSGRADAVIGYDHLEVEALRSIVPAVRDVHLAPHPSTGLCRCSAVTRARRRLLIVFNGKLGDELQGQKFDRWVRTIKRGITLAGVDEVHLRFHPRTSEQLEWPRRLTEAVGGTGCEVVISDPMKESIPQIACNYVGVIGGPSGSLKVARASCDQMFVVGLPNCGDGTADDQEWTLGTGEGIVWIGEGEELEARHLEQVPTHTVGSASVGATLGTLIRNRAD
jgi:hypothetical protein